MVVLSFEMTRNIVYDDGFDGWSQDEHKDKKGTDRFVYASIGVSYAFAKKNKGNTKDGVTQQVVETIQPKIMPINDEIDEYIKQAKESPLDSNPVLDIEENTIEEQAPAKIMPINDEIDEYIKQAKESPLLDSNPVLDIEENTIEEQAPALEGEENTIEEQAPVLESEENIEPESIKEEWLYYTVQSGDTGGFLLQKLGCTKEELCKWNNLNLATWSIDSGGLQLNQELRYKN